MKKWIAWLLMLMMTLSGTAWAEETPVALEEPLSPYIEDTGLELMGSSVRAPQVRGLGDEALEALVNEQIMTIGGFQGYFDRMALLISEPVSLTVTYDAQLLDNVFLCVAQASGAVTNNRPSHAWTAVNIDLIDGHAITWDELFAQPAEATEAIETYLYDVVAPELSAHLSSSILTPLPDTFGLSPYGVTLLYPIDQLSTLADRAGAITILWSEIQDHLNLAEGSLLDRIGAKANLSFPENAKEALTEALADGSIPGVPAAIGQSMQELTDTYGTLIDPDLYEGGRLFLLDDSTFRQIYLLTDALTDRWDTSVVQGLRADRLNLLGLRTGVTTRDDYITSLGEPESTLAVDAERADSWRIVPGTSDYYTLGAYRLRLHVDENGVLRSVFITP